MLMKTVLRTKSLFLVATFVFWIVVFAVQKPFFLLIYMGSLSDAMSVMWHGLPLDMSLSGYITAIPAILLLLTSIPGKWIHSVNSQKVLRFILWGWTLLASVIVSMSFVANMALYEYWQFPLDATPVFFITSSPKDAIASVEWWQVAAGIIAFLIIAFGIFLLYRYCFKRICHQAFRSSGWLTGLVMLVLTGLLFLPIRGGVKVSSMNTGKVYFSTNQRLNHAAVNPLFSFVESMTHQEDFAHQYRYMEDATAQKLARQMYDHVGKVDKTHEQQVLTMRKPDIYLFILESFSDTLLHTKGVTPNMNRFRQEGIWFSNFYANSFRTDRGLVSILLGYPSPATVSLMKYPQKTANIPSLPGRLKTAGWDLKYYYGGDADFTNMRSFLFNMGFQDIVEDVSFPVSARLSKWGVPDHLLFERLQDDVEESHGQQPIMRVIQTSSSHEPFDVPYHRLSNKVLNAFSYTDHYLGKFIDYLKQSGKWDHSLIILVPDHLGAWPEEPDSFKPWRFHIPMIWLGGCTTSPLTVETYGSQQDIAATILGQLGLSHDKFVFSKDMFNPEVPHFAFFMMNDGFGLVDQDNQLIYDNMRKGVVYDIGRSKSKNLRLGQAYTQALFDDIASR